MLSDANPQFPAFGNMINVYNEDVDATYNRALSAGATSLLHPLTSSTETGPLESRTSMATSGGSQPTSKMCLRKN